MSRLLPVGRHDARLKAAAAAGGKREAWLPPTTGCSLGETCRVARAEKNRRIPQEAAHPSDAIVSSARAKWRRPHPAHGMEERNRGGDAT